MAGLHAFVDESYRTGSYLLCAAVFGSKQVVAARRSMSSLLRTGQARIHMAKENDGRRRSLLTEIAAMNASAQLVAVQVSGKSIRVARDIALAELTEQLVELDVRRLVIESCDQDRRDMQIIGDGLARLSRSGTVAIHHLRPHDEPLLWIPDAIAWAYGKGGKDWRSLVDPLISRVTRL